jgi:hypothetical protein
MNVSYQSIFQKMWHELVFVAIIDSYKLENTGPLVAAREIYFERENLQYTPLEVMFLVYFKIHRFISLPLHFGHSVLLVAWLLAVTYCIYRQHSLTFELS